MKKYVVLDKKVGETPLECAETWRATVGEEYQDVPLAYAGRLDPMASGKLLVLIGEECKQQEKYHGLEKEYEFSMLLGVRSDSGDVLGLVKEQPVTEYAESELEKVAQKLTGDIELPYPHYSSKTVQGKPLHTWTIEGRLDEITIPTKHSQIHKLELIDLETLTHEEVYEYATSKIETIPPVTDPKKALGNDFRRPDVRVAWQEFNERHTNEQYQVAAFRCVASSGTYMRTLAEVIARELGTAGLAYHIHRNKIGHYQPLFGSLGFWRKLYK